jgi:hypothetical protein
MNLMINIKALEINTKMLNIITHSLKANILYIIHMSLNLHLHKVTEQYMQI